MLQTTNQSGENCHFCQEEIIGKSFCTTSGFKAFYNIAPILPGHSLIIPNKHYVSLFELSDKELGEMMVFARKITSVLKTFFNCDGFDWTIQDGISAGQTVPHLHLHIIPRKPLDLPEGNNWYSKIQQSKAQMFDSHKRERLSDQDYNTITANLAEASHSIS
jgi:bis(5'-adenosyl)-triphosphatase